MPPFGGNRANHGRLGHLRGFDRIRPLRAILGRRGGRGGGGRIGRNHVDRDDLGAMGDPGVELDFERIERIRVNHPAISLSGVVILVEQIAEKSADRLGIGVEFRCEHFGRKGRIRDFGHFADFPFVLRIASCDSRFVDKLIIPRVMSVVKGRFCPYPF